MTKYLFIAGDGSTYETILALLSPWILCVVQVLILCTIPYLDAFLPSGHKLSILLLRNIHFSGFRIKVLKHHGQSRSFVTSILLLSLHIRRLLLFLAMRWKLIFHQTAFVKQIENLLTSFVKVIFMLCEHPKAFAKTIFIFCISAFDARFA